MKKTLIAALLIACRSHPGLERPNRFPFSSNCSRATRSSTSSTKRSEARAQISRRSSRFASAARKHSAEATFPAFSS